MSTDSEIDPNFLMQEIREKVRKRNMNGKNMVPICRNGFGEDDFNYINSNWDLRVDYKISSHRSLLLAKLLIFGRNLVHGEVKRYVSLIVGKQAEFNTRIIRILSNIVKNIDSKIDAKINESISSINKDIDVKIDKLNKDIDVKIDKLNKDIDVKIDKLNKDIDVKIDKLNKDIDVKIDKTIARQIQKFQNYTNDMDNVGVRADISKWQEIYKEEATEEWLKMNIKHHDYLMSTINKYSIQFSQGNIPKLIEVGIGTATMSIYFSKMLYDVLGIDNNPIIISKAISSNKRLGGYAKFICLDAFDLQNFFKEKLFDIAFSQGTLEHFDNNSLKRIIDAQLHIAKCVVFSVPSVNYPDNLFGNERKMNIDEWNVLLKDFGYTVEHLSYYQEGDIHIIGVILP